MKNLFSSIAGGLLCVILALQAPAATFVAPEEGGCTLRVDRIPLDVDTMSGLSEGLAVIAKTPVEGFPARNRRASAQALALALALDPASDTVRKTLASFTGGESPDAPPPESLIKAKALAWQLHAWLSTEEAGDDGRQLSALMGDSLRYLDPEHPSATALGNSPEAGNWEGWVASLDSFKQSRNNDTPKTPQKPDFDPFEGIEEKMPKKEEAPSASTALQIKLSEASVRTLLFEKNDETDSYELKPINITMNARKANPDEEGFFVSIEANENKDEIRNAVASPIYESLKSFLPTKPAPGRISIKAGEKSYPYTRNADNLTGPGFALASAAFSGNAPVGTIIARLGKDGKLEVPASFWTILRGMTDDESGRLVIPASAENYMLALLTMEEKSFFLRYEVLVASTPAEMVALSSSKPSPEHAAAFEKFDAIRKKGEGTSTGVYVANRFVLQRLEELAAEAPYHLSARLLAMQGAGKRPRALTREFLAAELLLVIDPVRPIIGYKMQDVKKDTIAIMDSINKDLRDTVEILDRLTDIRDRDLLGATRDLNTSLKTLIRELSKSGEYWEKESEIDAAKNDLQIRFADLRTGLSGISGIPLPE